MGEANWPRTINRKWEDIRKQPGEITQSIRVFVSCTFRDMIAERDVLESRSFPMLREFCQARGLTLTCCDLGWGVTPQGGDPIEALRMCLDEVSRSFYFIGLLGENYGTEFDSTDQFLFRQYPWLVERSARSFVELECVCGALGRKPTAKGGAFFYMRSPDGSLASALDTAIAPEGGYADQADIVRRRKQRKLAALKADIQQSGALVRDYAVPVTLAEFVYRDLSEKIANDFPNVIDDPTCAPEK